MTLLWKWLTGLLAIGVLAGTSALISGSPAFADTVPFQDEYQHGTLTFCDAQGQPVTSGRLTDVPFVWSAVSSTPAPTHYTRAYLVLYQPMQYEDAGDWTGYQMTVQAKFSNAQHPMAQATFADQPLLWPDQQIPPYWEGLYEVRMYFTQPEMPAYTSAYPAAVIRVTGNSWELVSGGGGECDSGSAVSEEIVSLPKAETEVPHVLSANGKNLKVADPPSPTTSAAGGATSSTTVSGHSAGTISSAGSTETSQANGTSSSSLTPSTVLAAGDASKGSGGGGSTTGVIAGLVGAGVVLGVLGWIVLLRHRRARIAKPTAG